MAQNKELELTLYMLVSSRIIEECCLLVRSCHSSVKCRYAWSRIGRVKSWGETNDTQRGWNSACDLSAT